MKLYKLKSFEGNNLLYILDMIIRERLHLSTCKYMNDVDEGSWESIENRDDDYIEKGEKLRIIIDKTKFTCFLQEINNPLMWAHYAGGFSGIALEYEIDPSKYDLRKIDYHGTPFIIKEDMKKVIDGKLYPQDLGILKQKAKCWNYETEWRLYGDTNQKYVENIKPVSVIFGVRHSNYIEIIRDIAKKYNLKRGHIHPVSDMNYEIFYL